MRAFGSISILLLAVSASALQWSITQVSAPPSAKCNDQGVHCPADCSYAEVSAAVQDAANPADGQPADTVILPACPNVDPADNSQQNVWTQRLSISKRVNLIGQGMMQTVLIDNRTPGSGQTFIDINTTRGGSTPWSDTGGFRISSFTVQVSTTAGLSVGEMQVSTGSHALRIDHMWMKNIGAGGQAMFAMVIPIAAWGVIDHTLTTGVRGGPSFMRHQSWQGIGTNGDNSWAQPTNMGTQEALFSEDNANLMTYTSGANFTCGIGGRCVYRYNYMPAFGGTSTEGTRDRSKRFQEIYKNQFQCNDAGNNEAEPGRIKGGIGMFWGNTVHTNEVTFSLPNGQTFTSPETNCYGVRSNAGPLQIPIYRTYQRFWGGCDGRNVWDNNDTTGGPNHDGLYDSGTIGEGSTVTVINDPSKNWEPNKWQGYMVSVPPAGELGRITANTETSLTTYRPAMGNWPVGSTYEIRHVYDCLDSTGRGQSALLSGTTLATVTCQAPPNPTVPACEGGAGSQSWVNNKVEPIYMWLNTKFLPTAVTLGREEPYRYGKMVTLQGVADPVRWWWSNAVPNDPNAVSNAPAAANRDVYEQVPDGTFDGTIGVGVGPVINRPPTCTPNPRYRAGGPGIPGVGWWDPDTETLSVCTEPNTWTENYYRPFKYPHPLRSVATMSKNGHLIETGDGHVMVHPKHRKRPKKK